MQQWFSDRVTIDLYLRVVMVFETLDEHQIDLSHPLQQLVERGLGRAAQFVHQRPTLPRGNHHLLRARLPVAPGILSRLIDVKRMVGMLYVDT